MKPTTYLLLFLTLIVSTVYAQHPIPTQAPEQAGFTLGSDKLGSGVSSVNLFTGEVSFPVHLASLPGRNGLGPSVSIGYNSAGVSRVAQTWNREAPTGVLGLGWTMDLPKIIADHKETASRIDDEYYLIEGGISTRLIYKSGTTTKQFISEGENFWTVLYDPGTEQWTITKGDGSVFVYGDKNSGRGTVQWLIRWRNWIGNSGRTTDQIQMTYAWNLSSITNRLGDALLYRYKNVEQYVGGSSGKKHTEASYIEEITGPSGEKILFSYASKTSAEYYESHAEKAEPDAYQENYEKLYLHHLDVLNEYNYRLNTITFDYTLSGSGELTKRMLTGISTTSSYGEVLPGLQFEYEGALPLLGKLNKVITASGASLDYTYSGTPVEPEYSTRDIVLNAPSGYAEPEIYWGPDYAIVSWRQLSGGNHTNDGRNVKAYLYSWEGYWKETFLGDFSNVTLENGFRKHFLVKTARDFFAIAHRSSTSNNNYYLKLFQRDKRSGDWVSQSFYEDADYGDPVLLAGERFIALHTFRDGDIFTYIRNGSGWTRKVIDQSGSEFEMTAENNWIISHQKGGTDYIKHHHLTEDNRWVTNNMPFAFQSDHEDRSYWRGTGSFALAMAADNPEFIYRWNEDFTAFQRYNFLGELGDASYVFLDKNGSFKIADYHTNRTRIISYNGLDFSSSADLPHAWFQPYTFGADFLLHISDSRATPLVYNLYEYDANQQQWVNTKDYSITPLPKFLNGRGIFQAGINSFTIHDRIYFKNNDGTWSHTETLNVPDGRKIQPANYFYGSDYVLYSTSTDIYADPILQLRFLRNGRITATEEIAGLEVNVRNSLKPGSEQQQKLVGNDMFAAVHKFAAYPFENARQIQLFKPISEGTTGQQQFYPVVAVSSNTGFQTYNTAFDYHTATATVDQNGLSPQFNKVKVAPGSVSASSTPFGYTENYFFNGLASEQSALPFPNRSINTKWYRNVLKGSVYTSISYDAVGTEVSRSETSYQGFTKYLYDNNGDTQYASYYVRPSNTWSVVDGIEAEVNYAYNEVGQLSSTTSYNYNSKGKKDILTTYHKYWWEAYDPGLTGAFLGPVVQTKSKVNTTFTSSAATVYRDFTSTTGKTVSMPVKSYQWKGSGSPDFSAWTGVPAASDWQQNGGEIIEYNDHFQVVQSKDLDDKISSNIYDHNGLPIASAYNARPDNILVLDFDDHDLKNSSGEWEATPGWAFENGVFTHPETGSPAYLFISSTLEGTGNYIAEFDFKMLEGTGYLGYHFTQDRNDPGYGIRISNQTIGLYYQDNLIAETSWTNDKEWHHLTFRHGGSGRVFLDGEELFETVMDFAIGDHLVIVSHSVSSHFDNFRLHPEDAYVVSTSYDRHYKWALASTDAHGLTTKTLYNSLGADVASIGIDNNPVATLSGYSPFRDKGHFDVNDPPVIHKVGIKDKDGFYEDFTTANPNWTYREFNNGTTPQYSLSNGELLVSSNGGATNSSADIYYLDLGHELKGLVGVEFDLRTVSPGNSNTLGLALGGDIWDTRNGGNENAIWMGLYGTNRLRAYNNATGWREVKNDLKPQTTYRIKVLVDLETQRADYYVDGKLYLNGFPLRYNTTGIQKVAVYNYGYGGPSTYAVDNLVVYSNPIQSVSYLDAVGNTIQEQSKESENGLLVTEYLYDQLGRNDVSTKTTRVAGDFGFRENFVTAFSRTTNEMLGEVVNLNVDSYYPYTAAKFESSPLGRVIEQSRPGTTYRPGSGKNGRVEYLTNADVEMGPEFPVGKYRVVKTVSPDGGEGYVMTDMAGNTIKEMSGPVTGNTLQLVYTNSTITEGNTQSFIAKYTHEISYTYDDFHGPATAMKIGTTAGGQEIASSQGATQGSFQALKGQRYYFTVTYTPYYDFDCVTEITYNPKYCFNGSNCRIPCPEPIVYYDFDCVTEIPYNADYCYNTNNCRIVCPCVNSEGQRVECPVPASQSEEEPSSVDYSYLFIEYADSEELIEGQEIYLTTQYEYDTYGDLVKVYPPNYFNPPSDPNQRYKYIKTMKYDFFGRLREVDDPDQGKTRYIYNEKNGRLRFSQDANGAANTTVNYITYDDQGRTAEAGYFTSFWSEYTLQQMANGSGPSDGTKRIGNFYQADLNDNIYTRGRLTYTAVNNDATADFEVFEYFTHGRYGIEARGIRAEDYKSATYTISYESDNMGNLIKEELPDIGAITYKYDQLGRLSAIGEEGNEDLYARYEYNHNGQLEAEILNDNAITRDFNYDSPGNITRIEDPHFRENLSYTSGGYGGDGYYSGLIASTLYNYKGITNFAGSVASYTYSYRYDKAGRLEVSDNTANNTWDIGVGDPTVYDPNGNILQVKKGSDTKSYTYATGSNAVQSINGGSTEYVYDANGNITQSVNKDISNITYDLYFNKAVSTTYANGATHFQYGSDGERVMKTVVPSDGSDTHYTLYIRGGNEYPVVEKERIDAGDWHTKYFIYGLTGLIATKTITAYDQADLGASVATFEPKKQNSEAVDFGDSYREAPIVTTRLFNATPGKTSSYSMRLTGEAGQKVGISKSLQVYSGDTIRMKVAAKYLKVEEKKNFVPAALAGELLTSMGLPAGPEGNPLYQVFDNALAVGAAGLSGENSTVLKAFINYMFFDRDFNLLNLGYKQVSEAAYEDGSDRQHEVLELEFVADREGFAVVYLSNESREYSEVYFDDFTVEQASAPQLKFYSKDHLGSTRVVVNASGTVDARYDYNALGEITRQTEGFISNVYRYSGQEYDEELKLHNYRARQYDSELGRFYAGDPSGQFASPYMAMFNNPVNAKDTNGELAWFVPIIIGAVIGGTSQGIVASNNGDSFWSGAWRGALVGAAAGATAIGVTAGVAGASYAGVASGTVSAGFGASVAGGVAGGAVGGGLGAGLYGGDVGTGIWQGALGGGIGSVVGYNAPGIITGALAGGASGGLSGGLTSALTGGDFSAGFRNGALSGAVSGGIYGGIAAVESTYERNLLFGGVTKAGKMAFIGDYLDYVDAYNNGLEKLIIDNETQRQNGATRPVINGEEITLPQAYAQMGGTKSNLYLKIAGKSLRAIGSTLRHEFTHVSDLYSGYANRYFMKYGQNTNRTNLHLEIRGYRANIGYGYKMSSYLKQLIPVKALFNKYYH